MQEKAVRSDDIWIFYVVMLAKKRKMTGFVLVKKQMHNLYFAGLCGIVYWKQFCRGSSPVLDNCFGKALINLNGLQK